MQTYLLTSMYSSPFQQGFHTLLHGIVSFPASIYRSVKQNKPILEHYIFTCYMVCVLYVLKEEFEVTILLKYTDSRHKSNAQIYLQVQLFCILKPAALLVINLTVTLSDL